ncbi:TetR/AcrR family transcriptional regulator [Nonomuraea salmonea]|uniref:TetR/AcrR family transcriptional regulator n=1 Tax=Nonomuraea salmonea TaxID=46181 RepID=UPI0031E50F16
MGRKGAETRGRLLDTTQELIEAGGYFGAGLNQVIAASGMPRGSLYFHFPGGQGRAGRRGAAAGRARDRRRRGRARRHGARHDGPAHRHDHAAR